MESWPDIERRYGPLVWRTANRILGDYVDACDCYQEVFLAALKESKRRRVTSWPSLLGRLATRRSIDRIRQRKVQAKHQATTPVEFLAEASGGRSEAEEASRKEELIEVVRQGLARLPAKQSEAFWLRCVDELSYEEIAEQTASSPGAVRVLVHRARTALRGFMASQYQVDSANTGDHNV